MEPPIKLNYRYFISCADEHVVRGVHYMDNVEAFEQNRWVRLEWLLEEYINCSYCKEIKEEEVILLL